MLEKEICLDVTSNDADLNFKHSSELIAIYNDQMGIMELRLAATNNLMGKFQGNWEFQVQFIMMFYEYFLDRVSGALSHRARQSLGWPSANLDCCCATQGVLYCTESVT